MPTSPNPRSDRLGIRIEPDIRLMLDELAADTGLSLSDVIRQAVRREHAQRFGGRKPRKSRKRNA